LPNDLERKAFIGEILGSLERIGMDKYWLLEQVKQRDPKIPIFSSLTSYEILCECPDSLLVDLKNLLKGVDAKSIDVPLFSETYHWFFTDLVASSDPKTPVDDQAHKIVELNKLIRNSMTFRTRDHETTIILPTGDGNAIGFKNNPERPLLLAIELHKALKEYNDQQHPKKRIEVRIGLSTGPVYRIRDLLGNPNVWGNGIIHARRVMDLGRAHSILATSTFAEAVERLRPDFKRIVHLIGDYPIKHGEKVPVYNIYGMIDGMDVGTKKKPIVRMVQKSQAQKAIAESAGRFYYTAIEVVLNIVDEKTMMTHHTNLIQLVNQFQDDAERYFIRLEGDVPKDFPDLNVKISDEDGKELRISSLNVNKPLTKEFFVRFNKPLKPNQKGKSLKIEWDWEEPEKHYDYTFASDCKTFHYLLSVPRDMPIRQRVLKREPHVYEWTYEETPATTQYLEKSTQVEWTGSNILAFHAYRFDW